MGKIAEQIGLEVLKEGWDSYIAYGRDRAESQSHIVKIGNYLDFLKHVLLTRLTDRHGLGSERATKKLITAIKDIAPDIIQLQHLHGYFINYKILFDYLKESEIPVVWTFHDCWSFTGHCAHYQSVNCNKWKTECNHCPQISKYPKSILKDNSRNNFQTKKKLFNLPEKMVVVTVSDWMRKEVEQSFFRNYPIKVIKSGIDLQIFKNTENTLRKSLDLENKFVILGVAYQWNEGKGLDFFVRLKKKLDKNYQIVLVGLSGKQQRQYASDFTAIKTIKDQRILAQYYSMADVFLNPTLEESLGLTNIEALACGTPVITFNSGGSGETLGEGCGYVTEPDDDEVMKKILEIRKQDKETFSRVCREWVEKEFDSSNVFLNYINIYKSLLE